jgi:predicted phage terminase large subunit-like protein
MSLNVSPQAAAQELLRRRRATESLIGFTEFTLPHYVAATHHHVIGQKLDEVLLGEANRIAIFMPPRHGKSELASRRFPAYTLGKRTDWPIIAASYNSDLASDFGRSVRNIIADEDYRLLFPEIELAADNKAANRWATNKSGSYMSAGVGTAATGRGAKLLLIDDPVKDREEADSVVRKERVWDWYRSTAYTRLEPNGSIVLIQTRWSEDDLAGRIIDSAGPEEPWEIIEFPAIDDKGEALWPERYSVHDLERIKGTIGPREWSALYQQRPAPEEGAYFKREWFRTYARKPNRLRTYGASDYAVTPDGGDYTVHIVVGIDEHDNIFVLDLWRAQTESDIWVERLLDMIELYKPLMWAEEKDNIGKALSPIIAKRMNERRVYCMFERLPLIGDKAARARGIQARAAMGKVYLPEDAPWLADFMHELLVFDAGKHDDQVDAFGCIGRMLDKMIAGEAQTPVEPARDRWDRAFDREGEVDDWKVQ